MEKDRSLALELIGDKLNKKNSLTYQDIAELSGFHPKYILYLKRQLLDGTLPLEHGNKNRKPSNAMPPEEEQKIVNLYRRSNASVKQFVRFYGRRSYSCIYNVLKRNHCL